MTDLFPRRDPRLQDLADALATRLPSGDKHFARNLLANAERRQLSDKEWFWVVELVARIGRPKPAAPQPVPIASLAGVVALLERARQHLKYPAVLVRVGERDMRLSIAGPHAAAPGSINVASPGTFAERTWFGRVLTSGVFEPSRRESQETATAITAALEALATDPAKAASEYGRLTGVCCFCGLALTDERSTAVGYGRICAQHYGLAYPKLSEVRASKAAPALRVAA